MHYIRGRTLRVEIIMGVMEVKQKNISVSLMTLQNLLLSLENPKCGFIFKYETNVFIVQTTLCYIITIILLINIC